MKKVGIMSMQRIANYGSFLQAYALKQLIEELGCKVEFVDYHVGTPVIAENADSKNKLVRKIEKGLETFRYQAPLAHKLAFIRYKQSFAKKYMPLLGITDEMNYNPTLDCLVIGSDEVFNCIQKNSNVGYALFLEKCKDLVRLLDGNRRIAMCCCQNYGRLMHLQLYENQATEIQQEWNSIVEILKQCNYDEDICKTAVSAANEYFHTLIQRKKDDELAKLEDSMDQVHQESGLCEAAEIAALCLANLYKSGGQRKITPEIYEKVKKYLRNFPESMRIRAAFIITSEAIYSQSAEYKRVPDRIINDANKWSMQYPSEIEFQEGYFGLLFSRLKYAQEQDMRNEQRRVFREMKKVAGRANYSEYNEHNQLMDTVEMLQIMFGY